MEKPKKFMKSRGIAPLTKRFTADISKLVKRLPPADEIARNDGRPARKWDSAKIFVTFKCQNAPTYIQRYQ